MPRRSAPHTEATSAATLAIIYARVSTEEQARKGYSLPEQLDACRERARKLGYPPERTVECIEDEGAPGEFVNRPALERARELVGQGNVGTFICMDPDRFSRDLLNQLLIDRELQRAHVRLEFVLFNLERTPMGQAFFQFRGIMSELEKAMIRERTMRGRLGKAKRGGLTHNVGPYGYRFDPDTDQLVEDDSPADPARSALGSKAAMARTMFEWARDGGHAIARRLNDLGIPSPRGTSWSHNVVRSILRNEAYAGTLYLHRYDKSGVSLNKFRSADEKAQAHVRPQGEWLPISVLPLVPRDVWQRAQQELSNRRRQRSGAPSREYLLSGLVRCGYCGSTVHGFSNASGGKRYAWYVCTARSPGLVGKPKCMLRHLRAVPLEEIVWSQVRAWLQNPAALLSAMEAEHGAAEPTEREMRMNQDALDALSEAQVRVVRLVARGLVDEEQAETELTQIRASQKRLKARQGQLAAMTAAVVSPQRQAEFWRLAKRVRNSLDSPTEAKKKQLIRELVAEVIVRDPPEVLIIPRV